MGVSKAAMDSLQKTFGKEAVMKLSDNVNTDVDFYSTGSLWLDHITGGFPKGRIIELYGPESSGKTTTAIHAMAEVQKEGGNCAIIDAEHAFDKEYAGKLGVDVDELVINQPDNGEQALDIALAMINTGEFNMITIDSTSALVPKAELEGDMDDSAMGKQARLLSKGLRMITGAAKKHDCTVIFISQLREKIGVVYGSPIVIGVGNAMKYWSSQRIEIKNVGVVKDGDEVIGHTMQFFTKKNKVFPPSKKTQVFLRYGVGYDRLGEILDMAVEMEIVKKSGSWYSYGETRLGQGEQKVIDLLQDNPELSEELESQVIEGLKQQ